MTHPTTHDSRVRCACGVHASFARALTLLRGQWYCPRCLEGHPVRVRRSRLEGKDDA